MRTPSGSPGLGLWRAGKWHWMETGLSCTQDTVLLFARCAILVHWRDMCHFGSLIPTEICMTKPCILCLFAVLATLAMAMGCACKCPEPDPEAAEKTQKALSTAFDDLRTIAKDVPDDLTGLERIDCPDNEIRKVRKKMKKPQLWGKSVDFDQLDQLSRKPKKKKKREVWGWMSWDTVGHLELQQQGKRAPKRPGDIRYWLEHDESRYLAVFKAISRKKKTLPVLEKKPSAPLSKHATAVAGKHFQPGIFQGWIFVYDRVKKKRICQIPILVKSHNNVEYKKRGPFSTSPGDAIQKDFVDRFRFVADEQMGEITGQLKLSMW